MSEKSENGKIRVMIVDDHPMMRNALRTIISMEPDFVLAAEADSGQAAIDSLVAAKPDVILMDGSMPEMNGMETTRRLRKLQPDLKIIGLTLYEQTTYLEEIGERTGNNFGLTGLASSAKIIPVRVLDSEGFGTARDIARGIRFAADHKAQVINMSFEFSLGVNGCSKIKGICRAIKYAFKKGALVVAAAGNENGEPVAYPAGAPHVIGVGRTTKDACLASDSRTGTGLDLVAPGGGYPLLTTCGTDDSLFTRGVPIFQLTFNGPGFTSFGYPGGYEGTSMAAAHVSGVAAMVIASRVVGSSPDGGRVPAEGHRAAHRRTAGSAVRPAAVRRRPGRRRGGGPGQGPGLLDGFAINGRHKHRGRIKTTLS